MSFTTKLMVHIWLISNRSHVEQKQINSSSSTLIWSQKEWGWFQCHILTAELILATDMTKLMSADLDMRSKVRRQ